MPVAVGRTAVAVGGLADSGIVFGLTRSRLWIGLLAGLLVGIVGLNVAALQLNAGTSKTAALSEELLRENSALRAEIADQLSNERLQRVAARLGLVWPEPTAIRYLDPRPRDAAAAAARLRAGEITVGAAHVPATPVAAVPPAEPVTPLPTESDPVVAPVEAAAPDPAPAEATAAAPQSAASEPAASEPAAVAGGIAP